MGKPQRVANLSRTDFKAAISWYGDYVTITDQVQFVVQDRKRQYAVSKFSLIDLEIQAA